MRRATFLTGDPALPAPDVQLSTEEDPDATQLSTEMQVGNFIIVLLNGHGRGRGLVRLMLASEQLKGFVSAAPRARSSKALSRLLQEPHDDQDPLRN